MSRIRVNKLRQNRVGNRMASERRAKFNVSADGGRRQTKKPEPLRASMWTVPRANSQAQFKYEFPFTPQQIQYSNLSPEVSEIQRPGRTPLVAFTRYRARQLSLKFLIAVPLDGLFSSVDQSIQDLQRLVNSASPVYFTNLDRQITNSLSTGGAQQIFWSITDFSLSSIRRNAENQITAAEGTLTLVENNNPKIKIADLPRITYTVEAPQNNRPGSGPRDVDLTYPTWTETEAGLVSIGEPG